MLCQNCKSPNIQKLSLVYENGVAHMTASNSGGGVGVGIGTGGVAVGVGVGGGTTHGTSVSATAMRAAPPAKRTTPAGVWFVILTIAALFEFARWKYGGLPWAAGFTLLALWAFSVVLNVGKWNTREWPHLWAAWNAQYLCTRCGSIGVPIATAPAAHAVTSEQPAAPMLNVTPVPPGLPPQPAV